MQKIFPFTIRVNFQVLVLKDMLPAKMLLKTREEKNLLCVLVRLHADAKQKVSGRTSFNISARNELKFVKTVWGIFPQSTPLQPTCQPSIALPLTR